MGFTIATGRSQTIDPDEINAARLPRTLLGGYERGPTDDLLRRVAWDYRQVVHERRELVEALDELTGRIVKLEGQVARAAAAAQTAAASREPETVPPGEEPASGSVRPRPAEPRTTVAPVDREERVEERRSRSSLEGPVLPGPDGGLAKLAALEELRRRVRSELRTTLGALDEGALGKGTLGEGALGEATPPTAVASFELASRAETSAPPAGRRG